MTDEDPRIKRLRIATTNLADARAFFDIQIKDAHAQGMSNRAIAKIVGVSHEQVRRILARST